MVVLIPKAFLLGVYMSALIFGVYSYALQVLGDHGQDLSREGACAELHRTA